MNISISTCFNYEIPLKEQFEMISRSGFTHVTLGSNYKHSRLFEKDGVEEIENLLREYNLQIDTIHGCCADQEDAYETMTKLVDIATELNVPVLVMHAITGFEISEDQIKDKTDKLMRLCERLEPYLMNKPVKIAIENLFPGNADIVLNNVLPSLNTECFGFCYDSSHEQVDGPNLVSFPRKYCDRLIAIHLSDRIKPFVDHAIPGEGFVDFDEIISELKETCFDGPILLELTMENSFIEDTEDFLLAAARKAKEIHRAVY